MFQKHSVLVPLCIYFLSDWTLVKAENIMLRRPRRLSSTFKVEVNGTQHRYHAYYASDGKISWPARSDSQPGPFWQGDLQGYFAVHNIMVSSDNDLQFASEIRNAYIGVSSVDVDCPDDDVIWCGQWPADTLAGVTLTFNCSHVKNTRFVRVWRNITGHLAVQEVEVQGTPSRPNASNYNKNVNEKVTTTVMSLNARSVSDCGIKCLETQPCLVFSYNPSADPSCLHAVDTDTTSISDWVTYFTADCLRHNTCDDDYVK
ncbi:uncharacterized protein LOC124264771 [Haliotis rubra]|uniref:uncharacterized protein LOC124264771 n=1 Tax=Haliotis rubra TaxID=36100 RepID=UPI001EE619E9|nr:uncharacterized protein LOC124264771 [Haliotis rubra]